MFNLPQPSSPRRRAHLAQLEALHADDAWEAEILFETIEQERSRMARDLRQSAAPQASEDVLRAAETAHDDANARLERAMALAAAAQGNPFAQPSTVMSSSSASDAAWASSSADAWSSALFLSPSELPSLEMPKVNPVSSSSSSSANLSSLRAWGE